VLTVRNPDWKQGRADGLREALDIIRALEADVAERLERPSATITRNARMVRRQAYRNCGTRIATRLRKVDNSALAVETELAKIGL
jgi:hypothetical protein